MKKQAKKVSQPKAQTKKPVAANKKVVEAKSQPKKTKKFVPKLKFVISDEKLDDGQTIILTSDQNGKTIPELLEGNDFAYCQVKFPESHISISRNLVNKRLKTPKYFVYHPNGSITNEQSNKYWDWSIKQGGFKNNNLKQVSQIVEKFAKKLKTKILH